MSVEDLKEALAKKASGKLENDKDKPVYGQNPMRAEIPASDSQPEKHRPDVVSEARDERAGVLEELFDSIKSSRPAERELIGKLFNPSTVSGADIRSVMLRDRPEEKYAEDESLTDQVNRKIGRQ